MAGESTLTIQQLTGRGRTIVLRNEALPFKPFTMSGKQKLDRVSYTGNPNATMTVHGSDEDGTTINGYWCDKHAGDDGTVDTKVWATLDGAAAGNVRELEQAMTAIRREGQRIRVTWLHITRTGIMTSFKADWQDESDLTWEAAFEWDSPADVSIDSAPRPKALAPDLSASADEVSSQVRALTRASFRPFAYDLEFATGLNDVLTELETASENLSAAATSAISAAFAPADSLKRIAGLLSYVELQAAIVISSVNERADVEDFAEQDSITFGDVLGAVVLNRRMVTQARSCQHAAARHRAAVVRQIDPDLLDVVYAEDGQDLRQLSIRYYGTMEDWDEIRAYNQLSGSALASGQVVFIPRLGAF